MWYGMIPDTDGIVSKLYSNRMWSIDMDFTVHDNHAQYKIQRCPKREKQVKLNGVQLGLLGL